jgi:3-oxoacyl-[acyl-carrier-protein] synthase-3
MSGCEIFKVAVVKLTESVPRSPEQSHVPAVKLDWFIPHQANLRIINRLVKRIAISKDQIILNLDR